MTAFMNWTVPRKWSYWQGYFCLPPQYQEMFGPACTDLELADGIILVYGKRLDIEAFFKIVKQRLNLEYEILLWDHDA